METAPSNGSTSTPTGEPSGRNVLLITTDQERWFSEDPVPLPAHRWLRENGTTFDRFYAASMACSPARSVIYTGRHSPNTGVIDNLGVPGQQSMSKEIPTLGNLLSERGYKCAYKGKWHLSDEATSKPGGGPYTDALIDFGFSDFNEAGDGLGGSYEGHLGDAAIARDAVAWIQRDGVSANAAGTPWCLAVNLVNPHDIMWATANEKLLTQRVQGGGGFTGPPETDLYRPTWDFPDDPTWLEPVDLSSRPSAHLEYDKAQRLWTGPPATQLAELREFRDYYLNCLREVDESILTLIEGLKKSGLDQDTVIVFTSDHGELAGAHGLFGKGPCAYDANIRIPLVIVEPGKPGGLRTDALGSQVDLVPTIIGLAGTSDVASRGLCGVNLTPAVGSYDNAGIRDSALFVYESLSFVDGAWAEKTFVGYGASDLVSGRDLTKRGFIRTLITDRYKFSRYFAPGAHNDPKTVEELFALNTIEVFDLEEDPNEMTNLAASPTTETMQLCEALSFSLSSLIANEIGDDDGRSLPRLAGAPWSK